ncbi:MAG: hypothetical protein ACOX8E_00855 [Ruminococcus sp.]|jgi:hypothetical protein
MSTIRTNRYAGLNINNSIRLAVGFTDQIQDEWENTDYVAIYRSTDRPMYELDCPAA